LRVERGLVSISIMQKRLPWIIAGLLLAGAILFFLQRPKPPADEFERLMTRGAGFLERGEATNAMAAYSQAVALAPESVDARLNLANAFLLADDSAKAIEQCQEVLNLDSQSGAAYYLMGLAHLRGSQAEQAVQAFQQSQRIDPAVTALNFQLGVAQERLGQLNEAIATFETMLQFDPEHLSAHYQLSRLYLQVNRPEDSARELEQHQQVLARNPRVSSNPRALEACKYTQPRMAFKLEQPDPQGIPVRFVEATAAALGTSAAEYRAPIAVLDYNHDGRNSLFVMDGDKGFRVLNNLDGRFQPMEQLLPAKTGAVYREALVGDLNNDRFEDVIVLGESASHAFRFATNGQMREVTMAAGLPGLQGRGGLLADLDFTGRLDLLTILPDGQGLRVYRNLGNFYFKEDTTGTGLPAALPGVEHLRVEDWLNEDLPGVFAGVKGQVPVYFAKHRAGAFVRTNTPADWPAGNLPTTGDLNNDLRPDLVVAAAGKISIVFGGPVPQVQLALKEFEPAGLVLNDYDNDGWLDIMAYGAGLRVWRNLGKDGFTDVTARLGLDKVQTITAMGAADFDRDRDTDLVLCTGRGLQFWRNDGGNANHQLKLQLIGNRSNASGLGVRVDLIAGRWRTRRTLQRLPFEIGLGQRDKVDSLKVHWFDLATTAVDVAVQPEPLPIVELTVPAGSCPYLYAWDGSKFRFVTDILGASPLGLPVAKGRYIEADPEEFLALGDELAFPPRDGKYEVRITEELREVLYLDQARLVVVDHPNGTVVHPTSKMRARKPFPPHELWTLRPLGPARHAFRSDDLDVTDALARNDQVMVSPVRLREPQLRGLAEPFSVTMDFGELPVERPLVLALTGWLRFGGGMANIAASLDPSLPFPFPALEAQLPDGSWQPVQSDVGAPAGKTKTILVDLANKLPAGTRRLRLATAFEIHWDSAMLCEKVTPTQNQETELSPEMADLRWHGFGVFENLPEFLPLTSRYDHPKSSPPWNRTPAGWCTRYGPVNELVEERDDEMALLNGGDEVALAFPADKLPPKREGDVREFFLHVIGWDKDADFHVGEGWRVEPLPFWGMDDQAYGREVDPAKASPAHRLSTRWVGPKVATRRADR
jgi:tetratricopeptide (TPR) repeat protein